MSFVPLVSIGFALALCVAPVFVLRRPDRHGEAAGPVPPAIVRNAWTAYLVRVSVFAPLVMAGASGDVWPAIAVALGIGAGFVMLGAMRWPDAAFEAARQENRPATLHEFIAQACGGANGIRRASALLTIVALVGLVGAEAAALVVVLKPLAGDSAAIALYVTVVVTAEIYVVAAGTDRVRYASQALLGAIFAGVFVSAAFLLYLQVSDLRPLQPYGAFAVIALVAGCVAILIYRRHKYTSKQPLVAPDETSRWRRTTSRHISILLKFLSIAISVFTVVAIVIAGMELYILGPFDTLLNSLSALGISSQIPIVGLAAIGLLALCYPLVDAVGWQNLGALLDTASSAGSDAQGKRVLIQRVTRYIAGETAMFVIVLSALGIIAALATDLPRDGAGLPDAVRQLILYDNGISETALTLLLVGGVAMSVSMMGSAIAAAVTVIRVDVLPSTLPERRPGPGAASGQHAALGVMCALAVVIAAVWIASGVPAADGIDARFFALALVFACLQLSQTPLLLLRARGRTLSAGAGLIVLGAGISAALASIAFYGAATDHYGLWLAAPACLAAGISTSLILMDARAR